MAETRANALGTTSGSLTAKRSAGSEREAQRLLGALLVTFSNEATRLAKEAKSESVQLRAWRAILADQRTVSKFPDLEDRMTEIEEQLSDRTGRTHHAG